MVLNYNPLLSPGASDKSLSLLTFSLYYCVEFVLTVNMELFVVCNKFYEVFAFLFLEGSKAVFTNPGWFAVKVWPR